MNERERIEQTLLSVITQTYKNRELIVIDGASTDGTLEIINKYKKDITHLFSEKDDGIYYAMNKGISLAKGDYLIFMNGGDRFYDKDVLLNVFNNKSISEDIIYGNVCYIFPLSGKTSINCPPEKINRLYLTNNTINHQSTFFRSTLFAQLGGFDTKYRIASDYDFYIRAIFIHKCSIRHIPLTISYFYKDGISNTGETKLVTKNETIQIQKYYFPKFFYYFTKCRYWLIDHKDDIFPKWLQRVGNSMFNYFFKPGNELV